MKYTLIQTVTYEPVGENDGISRDFFKYIGTFNTIEEAENCRNDFPDQVRFIIIQVW